MKIAAIVLAAGESRRMGRPKQLLRRQGTSLVRRAALAALESDCRPVVVVTGAGADAVRKELVGLDVRLVRNPAWSEGMASSIRVGVAELELAEPEASAVVLTACDQPHLDAEVVRGLCRLFDGRPGRRIGSAYAETVGVPALFERTLFPDLACLTGDRGAKSVLLADQGLLIRAPWPEGGLDVDFPNEGLAHTD